MPLVNLSQHFISISFLKINQYGHALLSFSTLAASAQLLHRTEKLCETTDDSLARLLANSDTYMVG